MQNTFVLLGISGQDPTQAGNTATVRLFDSNGNATDQEFTLPALPGADENIAPPNFQDVYLSEITPAIQSALTALENNNTQQGIQT